jgi:hypothetical protein
MTSASACWTLGISHSVRRFRRYSHQPAGTVLDRVKDGKPFRKIEEYLGARPGTGMDGGAVRRGEENRRLVDFIETFTRPSEAGLGG